jgi:hypothetical protein
MEGSIEKQNKINAKENIKVYMKMQKQLQEKKKDNLSFDIKETDYGLGHMYGSW